MGAREKVDGGAREGSGDSSGFLSRAATAISQRPRSFALLLLGLATLVFFGDLLFGSGDRVLSREKADVWNQFAGWRTFAFEEIRSGNFPLWNPRICSGMPYFSGLQSALLYPPNWLHLLLSPWRAINWGIALHFWWLGGGMFFFLHRLGVRPAAGILGALALMFGAPHLLHIEAGHLTNLCVMAWTPWLLWVIEGWRKERRLHWVAAGAMIVALQVFAGHAQYVYYGALASGLYLLLTLGGVSEKKLQLLAGFAGIYLWGALLAAVQLLPAIEAAGETLRGAAGADAKYFAGTYSFPPENLVTLLAPGFFGGNGEPLYWGRWSHWEMTAFCGVTIIWCALAAIAVGGTKTRALLITTLLCILLALGSYTPLFHVLYSALPGWSLFRGNSKFIFYAALFLVSIAALGFNRLLKEKSPPKSFEKIAGGALLLSLAGALWISLSSSGEGGWAALRQWLWDSGKVFEVPGETFFSEEFANRARRAAAMNLWIASGTILALSLLLRLRRRHPAALSLGILLLATLELGLFAKNHRPSFAYADLQPERQRELHRRVPGDFRVYDSTLTNSAMLSGSRDLWGEDPGMLERYLQFMGLTQKRHPDQVNQNLALAQPHPLWVLLRARYAWVPGDGGLPVAQELKFEDPVLERFAFFTSAEVHPERDALLERLFAPGFDPSQTLLLEEAPPFPVPGGPVAGRWIILREDSDEILVNVTVDRDCLMLMTDAYSRGWRAEPLDGRKADYPVLPADYCLRAIPLRAGSHQLHISYRPRTLTAGVFLSGLGGIGLIGCLRGKNSPRGAPRWAAGLLKRFTGKKSAPLS